MKKRNLLCVALTAALAVSAVCLAACTPEDEPTPPPPELGEFTLPVDDAGRSTNVHVHDPSVFQDPKDGKYYVFGSHYAVASSTDLIEWKQEGEDDTEAKKTKLFGSGGVKAAMPETLKLANNNVDAWAPDVEYYNGKYYMYISFTTAMYTSTSVISRVESDNVLGPYSNEKILVESIRAEQTASKPNCIDPELFYDKDGKLWMVYGSFFGGIYMKELHNSGEKWGLPKEDGVHDFGKLVWNGGHKNSGAKGAQGVEGPYVFYNAETDYYYLMTSESDLMKDYNMRIARSKSPNGPYVDSTGKDVAGEGEGNKIAGNYHFGRAGAQQGYAALGHNSVLKTDKGEFFVLYHARRIATSSNTVSAGHSLHASRLYFNEDGWPVMSPNAYVGEELGKVKAENVTSDFEVLLHSVETEVKASESKNYTFDADGKILSGTTEAGTWTLSGDYYITIVLDEVTYKGVVVPGWDMYSPKAQQDGVACITAVSDAGRALWAISK
ncbi:MAG: glycoside hydrolase family 43 protein [Clostridiales bacterium]|nr:glycoside hydrolase family 43 protein [Clostridiales bacterium]